MKSFLILYLFKLTFLWCFMLMMFHCIYKNINLLILDKSMLNRLKINYLRSLGSNDCAESRSRMYCNGGWRVWFSFSKAMWQWTSNSPGSPDSHITCWFLSDLTKDLKTSARYIWRVNAIWNKKKKQ